MTFYTVIFGYLIANNCLAEEQKKFTKRRTNKNFTMPSIAVRLLTSLLISHFCVALLSRNTDAVTPQRQCLDSTNQYESPTLPKLPIQQQYFHPNMLLDQTFAPLKVQQQPAAMFYRLPKQQNDNEIDQNRNPQSLLPEHYYGRGAYEKSLSVHQPQQFFYKNKETNNDDAYNALGPKYELSSRVQNVPAAANNFPRSANSHPSRFQLATKSAEIVYAPHALPPAQNYRTDREKQISSIGNRLGDQPAIITSTSHKQPATYHKSHSNQKYYAPKRRTDVSTPSAYDTLLPYPPSFISITSTSTTASPPHSAQSKNAGYGSKCVRQFPDIFAVRQQKSLIDSYIPSWVMARMLQQHKWLQQKQLHQFTATYTLAYPITKKST
ncbi:uncharacterized protein LOC128858968 [Anastrepha ludens]|uniref:uncharacterized protein LOC128858968 n=1 Tax=Anastrepha ludens TaxID=28586 RepID=UPI0023B206D6|nr:uncharacterized protein LOC128858968 [Anastrepha ludens]